MATASPRTTRKRKRTLVILILLLASPVYGESWQPRWVDGFAALQKNDYATALKHWRPLADQGFAPARRSLGLMYYYG